jgi:hypothetical protein
MTTKTIAERLVDAYHAGREAAFYTDDVNDTGTRYEFTPDGILGYVSTEGAFLTETVTGAELVSAGAAITIPAGSTLNEALQLIIDAVDPGP